MFSTLSSTKRSLQYRQAATAEKTAKNGAEQADCDEGLGVIHRFFALEEHVPPCH